MERIKEALQRASKERAEQSSQDSKVEETRVPRVASVGVQYKRTRIIEVRKKILMEKRIIAWNEEHQAAVAYKILRTQVLQRMQAEGWRTLAITSSVPMEGKTITSINLAISIAQHFGSTVLLADIDLRRPSDYIYG